MGFLEKKITIKKRYGTCSKDCYGSCFFIGEWDDEAQERKLLRTIPSSIHPFTKGFFCSKFSKREDLIYHPDRLKNVLERNGPKGTNQFRKIELKQAIHKISEKIIQVCDEFGPESIV